MGILREDSRARATWDLLIAGLVLITCWLVPFQVAFAAEVTLVGTALVLLVDAVFWADVFLNFRTTFRRHGVEVDSPTEIARAYRRTLLPVDLAANVPLDLVVLLTTDATVGGVSLVLLIRLLRLLRLARLFVIFRRWRRRSRSRAGAVRILRFVMVVAIALHLVACAWFLLPALEGSPNGSWVTRQGIDGLSVPAQYLRSLYWAVVTMTTVGYGDITPGTDLEHAFAIVVMLLGASLYAFAIGNIASLFTSLDAPRASFFGRLDAAQDYLSARGVEPALIDQVQGYYEHLWARYRGLPDQALFADLPDALRLQVVLRLAEGLLETVPLFRRSQGSLRHALVLALRPQILPPGVELVREGEAPEAIHFVSRGALEILSEGGSRSHGTFGPGDHFGLLSLTLGERRTAAVVAKTYCDVLVLAKADFERIKTTYPELNEILQQVASERGERLSELLLEGVTL
jgi:hypothetical protein